MSADATENPAEDEDATAEEAPQAPQGLKEKLLAKKKLILIALGALVIVGAGGAGIYFSGIFHTQKPHEVQVMLPDPPVNHDMQKIQVDLKPSDGHARPFIRVSFTAELQGETARAAFIANETKIMDAVQSHLRNTTVDELTGELGTETLRDDITTIINRIITPEVAITVLYKDIIIR